MFTNHLILQDTGDGHNFIVVESFEYVINNIEQVRVEAGFKTDLASIPRLVQNIIPKLNKANQASVTHDWLYRRRYIWSKFDSFDHYTEKKRYITRKEADDIYLAAMKSAGVRYTRRYAIYWAVRSGGWAHWNRCSTCS